MGSTILSPTKISGNIIAPKNTHKLRIDRVHGDIEAGRSII